MNDFLTDPRTKLVREAHSGQKDKAGKSYFLFHLLPVANMVPERLKFAALAHDLLEDTDADEIDMANAGFSTHEIHTVKMLTKEKRESLYEYIDQMKKYSPDAVTIKIADVVQNLSRLEQVPQEHYTRLRNKYQKTIELLVTL